MIPEAEVGHQRRDRGYGKPSDVESQVESSQAGRSGT